LIVDDGLQKFVEKFRKEQVQIMSSSIRGKEIVSESSGRIGKDEIHFVENMFTPHPLSPPQLTDRLKYFKKFISIEF